MSDQRFSNKQLRQLNSPLMLLENFIPVDVVNIREAIKIIFIITNEKIKRLQFHYFDVALKKITVEYMK